MKNNNIHTSTSASETCISRLYQHNVQSFWGTLVLATLLVFFLTYDGQEPVRLFTWYGLILLFSLIRITTNNKLDANTMRDEKIRRSWVNRYILLTTVINAIWGITAIQLYPLDTIIQASMLFILLTVLISNIPLLLTSKLAFYTQIIAILSPVTMKLMMDTNTTYMMLAGALGATVVIVIIASHYIHSVLLQLQTTQQALQDQADTDQLTKLANRRAFERSFKTEWRRTTREEKPLSLLMIDVDNFKKYNDDNGHQAGDDCLKAISSKIKSTVRRPGDLAARHGGEEFAVLLPSTDMEGAMVVAERLRDSIEQITIPNSSSSNNKVTVSIGVSSCKPVFQRNQDEGQDVVYPAMLMKSADYAMYQAKQKGKNQVIGEKCGMHSVPVQLKDHRITTSTPITT